MEKNNGEKNIGQKNEGEGNRTAAKVYNDATTQFAKSGKVQPAAREAEDSLDGPDAAALAKAEEKGRKPAHKEREV